MEQTQQDSNIQPEVITVKLSKKKLYWALGIVFFFIILAVFFAFLFFKKNNPGPVLTTVNNRPVYSSYIEKELEVYPGERTAAVRKMLEQKVIDDEVTLQAGKKEGLITSYPEGEHLSMTQYLDRTQKVSMIQQLVSEKQDGITGALVSIWFYNNGYIGPDGYEKNKQIAFEKISKVYDRVKNGEISIQQAGTLIATDKSVGKLDLAYVENSYQEFDVPKDRPITFWKKFDQEVFKLKPGQLSTIYLGDSSSPNGPTKEGVYLFAELTKNSNSEGYKDFDTWLLQKKKVYKIQSSPLISLVKKVFADDDNNTVDDSWQYYEAKCGHGCPPFQGKVISKTGAPVAFATVKLTNRNGKSQETLTDAKGAYFFEAQHDWSCGTSPMHFQVYVGRGTKVGMFPHVFAATNPSTGQPCGEQTKPIGNTIALLPISPISCNTDAVPTPKLACGKDCTSPSDCVDAQDGCTACITNASGKKVCSAPACGMSCSKNSHCSGAKDGCNVCVNGACQAPSCGANCTSQQDCATAKDGCTVCKENTKGANVCQSTQGDTDVCKCDGMDFQRADQSNTAIFPGDRVYFISYAKVAEKDSKTWEVKSITMSLYQSKLTDPENAIRIAESAAITPQILGGETGVRYRGLWSYQLPKTIPLQTLYRIQAKLQCGKKNGVLGVSTKSELLTQANPETGEQQQANTFSPGAQIKEKSCTFIKFFFN